MFIFLYFDILSVNERDDDDDDDDDKAVVDIWRVRRDVATNEYSKDHVGKLMFAMRSSLTNRVKNHRMTETFRHENVTEYGECSHRDVITYVVNIAVGVDNFVTTTAETTSPFVKHSQRCSAHRNR